MNNEYLTKTEWCNELSSTRRYNLRRSVSSACHRNPRSPDRSTNSSRKVASSHARSEGPLVARVLTSKSVRLRNRAHDFSQKVRKIGVKKASYWIVQVPWRPQLLVPTRSNQIYTLPCCRRSSAANHHRCCRLRHRLPVVAAARNAWSLAAIVNYDSRITTTLFLRSTGVLRIKDYTWRVSAVGTRVLEPVLSRVRCSNRGETNQTRLSQSNECIANV